MTEPLDCLSPENINNRFLESSKWMNKMMADQIMKESEFYQEQRIREVMEERGITRTQAKRVVKFEDDEREKEYNSPLKVAERKIVELENRLETIKEFINDPNYLDRFD